MHVGHWLHVAMPVGWPCAPFKNLRIVSRRIFSVSVCVGRTQKRQSRGGASASASVLMWSSGQLLQTGPVFAWRNSFWASGVLFRASGGCWWLVFVGVGWWWCGWVSSMVVVAGHD